MENFNRLVIVICMTLMSLAARGQTRYIDSLFQPNLSQQDVIYGNAPALGWPYLSETYTYPQDLLLDVYSPSGDTVTDRPCIVYAHGGAFLFGAKNDYPVVEFCERMTAKGYVVVSIAYRLGFNSLDSVSSQRATYRGIQDYHAAMRYVKQHASQLGIDSNKVYGAGNSAGSIMAIHVAFLDEYERVNFPALSSTPDLGCLSCSGNAYQTGAVPKAIANLWGAIIDTAFIEVSNNVPAISFHGDQDGLVSPNHARPFNNPFFPKLFGSTIIHQRLGHLSMMNSYQVFTGAGHEPWGLFGTNLYMDSIVEATANFFYPMTVMSTDERPRPNGAIQCYPNPATDKMTLSWGNTLKPTQWHILNAEGLLCMQGDLHGESSINLIVEALPAGWYCFAFACDGSVYRQPFIMQ